MIRIAQFNHPENGGLYGRPGDQLFPADGKTAETFDAEVNIAPVGTGWKRIFRPVYPEQGDEIADLMERTARNPHVGYSQGPTRYTFGDALRLADNDPDRIETDCNGDCSSGTAAVCNAAGLLVRPEMTTATEKRDLMTTRKFLIIEDDLRIKPELMCRGDILWREGHTAIVIDQGAGPSLLWMYASERVKMRLGPGINYPSIGEIPAGTDIVGYDPYIGPKGWALVIYKGRRCWSSLKYIKPSFPDDLIVVTGWKVNVRLGGSLAAPVVETARIDDIYVRDREYSEDLKDERGVLWYAVRLRTKPGKIGYISSMYAEVME